MDPGELGNEEGRLPPDGPDFDDQGFAILFDSDDEDSFDTDSSDFENQQENQPQEEGTGTKTPENKDTGKNNDPENTGLPTPGPSPNKKSNTAWSWPLFVANNQHLFETNRMILSTTPLPDQDLGPLEAHTLYSVDYGGMFKKSRGFWEAASLQYTLPAHANFLTGANA